MVNRTIAQTLAGENLSGPQVFFADLRFHRVFY
jgi:hypothetical protein